MRQTYTASRPHSARRTKTKGARREGDPRYTAYLFTGRQLDLPFSAASTVATLTSTGAGARTRDASR